MSRVRRAGGTLFLHMDRATLCGRLPLAPPRGNPSRATPCCQRRLRQQSHALTPSLCFLALYMYPDIRHRQQRSALIDTAARRIATCSDLLTRHAAPLWGAGACRPRHALQPLTRTFLTRQGGRLLQVGGGEGAAPSAVEHFFCSCPAWVLRGAGRRGHLDEVFPCRGRDLRARAAAAPPHPPSPSRPSGPSRRRREAATTLAQGRVRWHRGVRHRPCPFFAPRA